MIPNVLLSHSEQELETRFSDEFIAHIDGQKTLTLRQFYTEISDQLEIPDFCFTLDSLSVALNDLQWLDDQRIILYFTDTNELISKEWDPEKVGHILSLMDATAEDWKWPEDELNDAKELILVFEDSTRIRKILGQKSIGYAMLSDVK